MRGQPLYNGPKFNDLIPTCPLFRTWLSSNNILLLSSLPASIVKGMIFRPSWIIPTVDLWPCFCLLPSFLSIVWTADLHTWGGTLTGRPGSFLRASRSSFRSFDLGCCEKERQKQCGVAKDTLQPLNNGGFITQNCIHWLTDTKDPSTSVQPLFRDKDGQR